MAWKNDARGLSPKTKIGKDFPFSVIELRKDVHLALKAALSFSAKRLISTSISLKGVLHAKRKFQVI